MATDTAFQVHAYHSHAAGIMGMPEVIRAAPGRLVKTGPFTVIRPPHLSFTHIDASWSFSLEGDGLGRHHLS
jgi:hypothetical protein